MERLGYLGEGAVIAAADGYERTWNINAEPSQADDVSFLLQLIEKVTSEYPAADKDDVTIVGTSNGAAMIYRLLIVTGKDRPFNRSLWLANLHNLKLPPKIMGNWQVIKLCCNSIEPLKAGNVWGAGGAGKTRAERSGGQACSS